MTEEKSGKVGRAGGGARGLGGRQPGASGTSQPGKAETFGPALRPGHRARGQGGWTKHAAPGVRAQVGTVAH